MASPRKHERMKGFAGASANCKISVTVFPRMFFCSLLFLTPPCTLFDVKLNEFLAFLLSRRMRKASLRKCFWFDIWSVQKALTTRTRMRGKKLRFLYIYELKQREMGRGAEGAKKKRKAWEHEQEVAKRRFSRRKIVHLTQIRIKCK